MKFYEILVHVYGSKLNGIEIFVAGHCQIKMIFKITEHFIAIFENVFLSRENFFLVKEFLAMIQTLNF